MSLLSFQSSPDELISSWLSKYNLLVGKVIYDVRVVGEELVFYTSDGAEPLKVKLPKLGGATGAEATDYLTNYFIRDGQTHAAAISNIDAILHALAPATAESLDGKALIVNLPRYSARLSRDAAAGWSGNGTVTTGEVFHGLIMADTYELNSPDPATSFNAGRKQEPVGELLHVVNGSVVNQLPVSISETTRFQNASTLHVSSSTYNSIWQKGNARVSYYQGFVYAKHTLRHLDDQGGVYGGETEGLELWYDEMDISAVTLNAPLVVEAIPVVKMLSGIGYYGNGTTLTVTYNLSNIFRNCYHPTAVSTITGAGFDPIISNPVYVPRSSDVFYVNKTLHLTEEHSSGANLGSIVVAGFRPDERSRQATLSLAKRICTYGVESTPLTDEFLDEQYRLVAEGISTFNSALLLNGEAQVRNGVLVYGIEDYSGKTGTQQYQRFILKNPASSGTITLGGVSTAQLSAYETGDINLLLKLESGVYFDLSVPFGFGGDGLTPATAKGGKVEELSTATTTAFTFGQLSTADAGNGGKYRLILRLRNTPTGRAVQVSNIITT